MRFDNHDGSDKHPLYLREERKDHTPDEVHAMKKAVITTVILLTVAIPLWYFFRCVVGSCG